MARIRGDEGHAAPSELALRAPGIARCLAQSTFGTCLRPDVRVLPPEGAAWAAHVALLSAEELDGYAFPQRLAQLEGAIEDALRTSNLGEYEVQAKAIPLAHALPPPPRPQPSPPVASASAGASPPPPAQRRGKQDIADVITGALCGAFLLCGTGAVLVARARRLHASGDANGVVELGKVPHASLPTHAVGGVGGGTTVTAPHSGTETRNPLATAA